MYNTRLKFLVTYIRLTSEIFAYLYLYYIAVKRKIR